MIAHRVLLLLAALVLVPSFAAAKCIYSNPDAPLVLPGKPEEPAPGPVVVAPATPAITPRSSVLNPGFAYHTPGDLLPQDKGRGRVGDRRVYAPDMIFPVKLEPGAEVVPPGRHAFMNSQIWNFGGGGYGKVKGPGGAECSSSNYDPLLQRDNFCEVRDHTMPMCPSGQGHQGQDIRPPKCEDNKWDVVAVVDGTITQVTTNTTVGLKGSDGTLYEYLHMHPSSIKVKVGDVVKQGQQLGRISNWMQGSPSTTRHLHFNLKQTIKIGDEAQRVYVPVYASLIAAYRRSKGLDPGIDPKGNLIIDPLLEIGAQAEKDAPPITTWAIPNVSGNDGRAIALIQLSKYFRPRVSGTKLRYASLGLPQGLALDPETGEIRGIFDRGASRGGLDGTGAYTVTINADDGQGNKAQQSFVLTALYSPPFIGTATRGKFFKDGTRVLIDAGAAFLNYSDVTLTYTATGLPTGITITPSTGRISGRLSKTASKDVEDGVYTVSVTATDGKIKVTLKFTITAEPQKEPGKEPALPPPVVIAALPTATVYAGELITPIDTSAGFRTYGYEQLRYTAASLPLGLDIDPNTGRISGTPSPDALKGGDKGAYTVKVIADNGEGGTATQSFVISVQNRAPTVVISVINKVYKEGESVLVAVSAAFAAPDMSILKYTVTGLPPGVRFEPETGRVIGVVAAGAAAAAPKPGGVYTVTATADDGRGGRVSQSFAVTVEAQKAPPIVVGPIPATAGIEGAEFDPVATAKAFRSQIAGNVLTYSAAGLPPGLKIDDMSGDITGVPAMDSTAGAATKPYDVKVTATDPRTGLSASQQTTIVIVQAPKPAPPPEPAKPEPAPVPAPEPAKPEPAPVPAPEPAKPEPAPVPAPEPAKPEPAPVPEPVKPAPAPEPAKPETAPEPMKPVPAPEPAKPTEAPKPAPAAEPKKEGWGTWAYGYAKGAWDWASGLWTKKP